MIPKSSVFPTWRPPLKSCLKTLLAVSLVLILPIYDYTSWDSGIKTTNTIPQRTAIKTHKKTSGAHRNTQPVSYNVLPKTVDKIDTQIDTQPVSYNVFPKTVDKIDTDDFDVPLRLEDALKERSDESKSIIFSVVDYNFIDMALNLWETSFLKLGITNFLFACLDVASQRELQKKGIPCFPVPSLTYDATRPQHKQKREVVIDILLMGYSVLLVDVDIVFFKNPFLYMDCADCDIQWQVEREYPIFNGGFYYARPTPACIALHREAIRLQRKLTHMSGQECMDKALTQMRTDGTIKEKSLPLNMFPVGILYFQVGDYRIYAGDSKPCKDCVLVHNNWMAGLEAKRYRFKENLLWLVDENQYYSSESRKYLTYNNPVEFSPASLEYEIESMRAALSIGRLLNRTLILPTFHCHGTDPESKYSSIEEKNRTYCAMNTFLHMGVFDKYFNGLYREHMFLHHHKVPDKIKKSLSDVLLIESKITKNMADDPDFNEIRYKQRFTPNDLNRGATSQEIVDWFQNSKFDKYHVLRFHSLYGAFAGFLPKHTNFKFVQKGLCKSFKKTSYRQVGEAHMMECTTKSYRILS